MFCYCRRKLQEEARAAEEEKQQASMSAVYQRVSGDYANAKRASELGTPGQGAGLLDADGNRVQGAAPGSAEYYADQMQGKVWDPVQRTFVAQEKQAATPWFMQPDPRRPVSVTPLRESVFKEKPVKSSQPEAAASDKAASAPAAGKAAPAASEPEAAAGKAAPEKAAPAAAGTAAPAAVGKAAPPAASANATAPDPEPKQSHADKLNAEADKEAAVSSDAMPAMH